MSDGKVRVGDDGSYDRWLEAKRAKEEEEEREFLAWNAPKPGFFERLPFKFWLTKKRIVWFFEGKLDKIRKNKEEIKICE
jgi:hypothetical protein